MECRAAADPELRFSPSGAAVARIRTVASSRKKQDDGSWVDDKLCWMDVSAFGKLAENIAESVEKGDLLTIVGRLVTDEWNDRETGEKRSRLNLLADQVSVSLRFRTVRHGDGKADRSSSGGDDPWAGDPWAGAPQQNQQNQQQQQQSGATGSPEEPPF